MKGTADRTCWCIECGVWRRRNDQRSFLLPWGVILRWKKQLLNNLPEQFWQVIQKTVPQGTEKTSNCKYKASVPMVNDPVYLLGDDSHHLEPCYLTCGLGTAALKLQSPFPLQTLWIRIRFGTKESQGITIHTRLEMLWQRKVLANWRPHCLGKIQRYQAYLAILQNRGYFYWNHNKTKH